MFPRKSVAMVLSSDVHCNLRGDVAKWLRRRSAKPLFTGSSPVVASIFHVIIPPTTAHRRLRNRLNIFAPFCSSAGD